MKKTYSLLSLISLVFLSSNMYSMKLNSHKVYLFKVENKTNNTLRIYTNENTYLKINKKTKSFISHVVKTKKDFIKPNNNKNECKLPIVCFEYPILIKNNKNKQLAELTYLKVKDDSSYNFNTLFKLTQSSTQDNIDISTTQEKPYETKSYLISLTLDGEKLEKSKIEILPVNGEVIFDKQF